MHHVGVIQANPEQSKHLQTATWKVHGVMVDASNLRTESYDQHSRIPAVDIGTPVEDVERRDLTINALFYNVNEDAVEDFCGHGLSDLLAGVIRTPCEPVRTFTDDPLRLLRVARFAGRYCFDVDPAIVSAARLPEVKSNLLRKVTRERYGLELGKVFKGSGSPVHAIRHLCDFGLYDAVFRLPDVFHCDPALLAPDGLEAPSNPTASASAAAAASTAATTAAAAAATTALPTPASCSSSFPSFPIFDYPLPPPSCTVPPREEFKTPGPDNLPLRPFPLSATPVPALDSIALGDISLQVMAAAVERIERLGCALAQDDRQAVFMAAFLAPLWGYLVKPAKRWHQQCLPFFVLRESLRLPVVLGETVCNLLYSAQLLLEQILPVWPAEPGCPVPPDVQLKLGHMLRTLAGQWTLVIELTDALAGSLQTVPPAMRADIAARLAAVRAWIAHDSGLLECWTWRPLINGQELMKGLGIKGRAVGALTNEMLDWMILHPGASKDECWAWARSHAHGPSKPMQED